MSELEDEILEKEKILADLKRKVDKAERDYLLLARKLAEVENETG